MNSFIRLMICLALTTVSLAVHAQSNNNKGPTPVEVENGPNNPVPVASAADSPLFVQPAAAKIPVTCSEANVPANGSIVLPICRRVDNGDIAFPVPPGMTFALTDVLTNRNALIQPGSSFFLTLRSSGGGFRVNFSGDQATSPSKHFVTPMVFVREGDTLEVNNGDISSTGTIVDVFLSGYLVESDSIGY